MVGGQICANYLHVSSIWPFHDSLQVWYKNCVLWRAVKEVIIPTWCELGCKCLRVYGKESQTGHVENELKANMNWYCCCFGLMFFVSLNSVARLWIPRCFSSVFSLGWIHNNIKHQKVRLFSKLTDTKCWQLSYYRLCGGLDRDKTAGCVSDEGYWVPITS